MPLAERILHPTKLRKRAETEAMVQGRSNLELKERLGDSVSASEHPKPLIFLALICDSTVVFLFQRLHICFRDFRVWWMWMQAGFLEEIGEKSRFWARHFRFLQTKFCLFLNAEG